jgi:hypothetical protein
MALTKISTDGVKDDAITKAKIPADQIEASELANDAVDTNAIQDDAVTEDKLANSINTAIAANTAKDLTALSASNLTSGTVPDARISASSVTQHASTFDDNNIINDISALALKINGIQNATRYNTNSTSVETFQDANGIASLTGMARDTTGGEYVASIIQSYGSTTVYSTTDLNASNVFSLTGTPMTASMMVDGITGSIGGGQGGAGYIPNPSGFTTGFGYELGADSDFGVGFQFYGASFYNFSTYGRLKDFKVFIEPTSGDGFGSALAISAYDNGSQNGSTIVRAANSNSYSGFQLVTPYVVPSNTTRFVMKFDGYYDNGNENSGFNEIRIQGRKLSTTVNNATGNFISNVVTAGASTTSMGAVITYIDTSGTATLNTDLKIYLSADNGSNFTQGTLVAQPDFATGIKMAKVNDVTVTAGTQLKYKVEVYNQAASTKLTQITGVSMQY